MMPAAPLPDDRTWAGEPPSTGWYWLLRRRDRKPFMAHYDHQGSGWRVSDSIGRTTVRGRGLVSRLYDLGPRVEAPAQGPVI